MTSKQRKELIKAQQGELDAVLMYNALAEKAKLQKDKNAFRQLALEEGRHASVFHAGVCRVFDQDIEFFRALCRHFKKAIGLPLVK